MSILNKIDNALIGNKNFKGHPVSSLLLEDKILYLQALALIMNTNGIIDDSEKLYMALLVRSFKIDFSLLNMLVDFSNDPDEKVISDFFDSFSESYIKQNFLFDALMMFTKMTESNEISIDLKILTIKKMADGLKISTETRAAIKYLLKTVNSNDSEMFFIALKDKDLSTNQFSYLNSFYKF